MTKTPNIGARTVVISAIGLLVASAVVAVVLLNSRATSSGHGPQSLTSSSGTSDPAHGSDDMPGMAPDPAHGSDDMPATSPTTESHGHDSGDVPGMDPTPDPGHGDVPGMSPIPDPGHGTDNDATGAEHGDSPEHGDSVEAAADRPLGPVLGTFGGGASAVMLTAGFLRRRDKARADAKAAARAARRSQS